MSIASDIIDRIVKEHWDNQPHPLEPSLLVKDFAVAVKLATISKFGGHATPKEAGLFWPQFQATGLSPQEYEHLLYRLAPLSYAYHNRPPTMQEIAQLKDKSPAEARTYFGDLPDKDYPHVKAADMVKVMQSAQPHAQQYLGRPPVKFEAQYLHHSGENPVTYYQRIANKPVAPQGNATTIQAQTDGVQTQERPDASGRRLSSPRGQPTHQ